MKIKLIASDLDDTLLNPSLRLSQRTVRAIRAAAEMGIPTVLATNRSYQATLPFLRELGITGPVITYGGAQIRDSATGKLLRELTIPAPLVKEGLCFAQSRWVYIQVHRDSDIFYPEACEWSCWYEHYIGYAGTESPSLAEHAGDATKLLMLADAARVPGLVEEARRLFRDRLWITSSKPTFIEMNHPEATKGSALDFVASFCGVHRENIVAFGDQPEVDGGMLGYAGLGVAMGNAGPALKEAADLVTASNAEDGVAQALEKLLRLGGPSCP